MGEQRKKAVTVGIETDFAKENHMRLLRNSILGVLVLAAMAVALAPRPVLADDDGVPIKGTFAVTYMRPSALNYCASGGTPIEAQGIGSVSKLGPLFLTVKKCLTFPIGFPAGTYTGTFKMTAGNGDTLEGTYAGTVDFSLKDENGYIPFQGTLTFTGGTGRLSSASGVLSFTAVASPVSVGVTAPTGNGQAFYLVQGTMSSPEKD
jgi:hypothetical protein